MFAVAALLVAAAASPILSSAGDTINSNQQYGHKLLQGTDDAEDPSPAEALTPVIVAFMGIDDSGTDAAGNGTAGTQGRGDGHGDGSRPHPPWDYCGPIRCNKYPNAVPVEAEVAAADTASSGAPHNNANGAAVGTPFLSSKMQLNNLRQRILWKTSRVDMRIRRATGSTTGHRQLTCSLTTDTAAFWIRCLNALRPSGSLIESNQSHSLFYLVLHRRSCEGAACMLMNCSSQFNWQIKL